MVNHLHVHVLSIRYTGQSQSHHGQSLYPSDDLPKTVVMTLNQGSTVKSMDFHTEQNLASWSALFYSFLEQVSVTS
ncbi:putative Topless family protein [Helianthus annuus]|uniref:Topless family protein n=1 Tax=Helianthus annuus TaxID=4232 RepID=A0A9K3EDH3_HELAN|nr:putative Topless family protein [Helianthus annuus]KAJ0475319.1 hypothetical protein HanHA300_Chr13g0464141 [Helianthus annuus]KAJ0479118.1 putative Topless family protein [Helianthus annuus]KAJ0496093.1 hypothetical protein HanHA89_Chr13g0495781 [Helianthus annuus]KAJ0856354.1 putative Topless family protein [Helianthus annuus]